MAVVGIVPAAGSGERLGASGPKALAPCGGQPLLAWSLEVLRAACARVVVALPPDCEPRDFGVAPDDGVAGGASRSESVLAGVRAAPGAEMFVVHDAARPLVTRDLVEQCVRAVRQGWDGAVAAARMADTVKEADAGGRVVRTLDRSSLWSIQTPQAFRAEALRKGLDVDVATIAAATDDASLVEAAGGSVMIVEAPPENLKVTRQVDLELAGEILRTRAAKAGRV